MLRVVKNALNEHRIAGHSIEYAMAPMHLAARSFAKIGTSLTCKRMAAQQLEYFVKSSRIFICDIVAEAFDAELADSIKIAARCGAQFDFSHAANGARR